MKVKSTQIRLESGGGGGGRVLSTIAHYGDVPLTWVAF